MNNGGKVKLNVKDIKGLNLMQNHSHSKSKYSPIISNDNTLYNDINNNKLKKNYFKKKINIQFPLNNYSSSYNYSLPSTQKNSNNKKNPFVQKLKDLINQRENKKGKQILNEYYTEKYMEMMKRNVDTYPNGINLSISNCETQYPINNLKEDDFFRKLKIFLDNYENNNDNSYDNDNNNDNNNDNDNNTNFNPINVSPNISYDNCSKKLNKSIGNKTNSSKKNYVNESIEEVPKTFRHNKRKYNFNNVKYSKDKNSLNKTNPIYYKEYNKTLENFHNLKIDKKNFYKDVNIKKEFNQTERDFKSIKIISDNYNKDNKTKKQLMNIDNEQKENKGNNKFKKNKLIKINNEIIEKNYKKEYDLQEEFISKIKLFIDYIENYYILSLTNFYHYFIKQLQLYNLEKIKRNKDSIRLLKRFQKARKVNSNYNTLSFNKNNNTIFNSINSISSIKKNNIIEDYGSQNMNSSKSKKENVSPDIYIPKNKIGLIRLSRNKRKNNLSINKSKELSLKKEISLNISNNKSIKHIDNNIINNVSTDFNSKNIFTSNKKMNLIKSRNKFYRNNNSSLNKNKTENQDKNIHIKNISSFDIDSKNNGNNEFIYSKKKPVVYLKPKNPIVNMKKMIISNNKQDINNKNNSNLKNINLYTKVFKNNSLVINNQLYNNKNSFYNTEIINSILIKNVDNLKSPIKRKSPQTFGNIRNIYNNKNDKTYIKAKISDLNAIDELVIKDIVSYDRKLWVTIKYIISEELIKKYSKMKIRKKLLNLKDNNNIFLNNDLKLLKQSNIESVELIPPITKLNTHIEKFNNKISIIEEKEEINFSNKIIDIIKIIQKCEKQNKFYFYKYFCDKLKRKYELNPLNLSHKHIFKNIKNSFQQLNELDISKLSNNIIESNENENLQDNCIINNKENNHKKTYWKRNLFPQMNIPRLKIEAYNSNVDDLFVYLNNSEINERNGFSEKREHILNYTDIYDMPKKQSSRPKRKKNKISGEKLDEKNKIKIRVNLKKDIIKEDEEMRKKNKIIFLLTNKFSYYNNCLRIIRNYFNIWKLKYKNLNSNKVINKSGHKDINKIKKPKNVEQCEHYEDEKDEESNNDNLNTFKDDGIVKMNDYINNKDISLSLNSLSKIKNQKRVEVSSISEDNKSIQLDKNELEEKIEYFRYYIINFVFKRKNNLCSEEEKEI